MQMLKWWNYTFSTPILCKSRHIIMLPWSIPVHNRISPYNNDQSAPFVIYSDFFQQSGLYILVTIVLPYILLNLVGFLLQPFLCFLLNKPVILLPIPHPPTLNLDVLLWSKPWCSPLFLYVLHQFPERHHQKTSRPAYSESLQTIYYSEQYGRDDEWMPALTFQKYFVIPFCGKCYSVCARPNTDLWSDRNISKWKTVNLTLSTALCLDRHLDTKDRDQFSG